ncbi:MAG TPA: NADH-quinone oxidoreductase subunit H, partial [Caulobacteraceae bacterium]|nr:NADH-quinone oxidoreductase subunit H [Caulobacteraceae bacterium]
MTSFWTTPVGWTLLTLGQILLVTLGLLLSCAFLIWGDRKLFAGVQMRKGPNVVGPFGLLQSFADLGKFLLKELMIPAGADKIVFLLAPLISVTLALGAWAAIPIAPGWIVSNINVGILYLFAVSSLGVYGIIMGGWASNSKYPFMGALRSAAQMISYEVSLGFVIVTVILLAGSMNLDVIVQR